MAAVRAYVGRSQKTIKRATLHLSTNYHDDIIKHVFRHCKVLQRLDILSGFAGSTISRAAPSAIGLKTLILSDCDVTLVTMHQLLISCLNLERAEFYRVQCFDYRPSWRSSMSKIRSLLINVTPHLAHGCGLVSKSASESYITY